MSKYFDHSHYYFRGPAADKMEDVKDFIALELFPVGGDAYYIMDPYLDVVASIQEPLVKSEIEASIWSWLMADLCTPGANFQIITRMPVDGIIKKSEFPPYSLVGNNLPGNPDIQVCKYIDTKYCSMGLHDRFIVHCCEGKFKGVHVGPSLADIRDKDVSVTIYTEDAARAAHQAFNNIWEACIKNKEWRK